MRTEEVVHATCVAWDDRAVIIRGASGSGKSALGLMLMAMGCVLIADDRVCLRRVGEVVIANCPDAIRNLIEARNIGLLNADGREQATVALVVDLDEVEVHRLPPKRQVTLLGTPVPLIHRADGPHFAASILQILKAGWSQR